jgi:hypothetical protein
MRNVLKAVILVGTFTLIAGCLIVGVANVRVAADRIKCTNNLHQIGIAFNNSAYTFGGQFPAAAQGFPDRPCKNRNGFSWQLAIVPYVESTDLFVNIDKDKGWDAEENRYLAVYSLIPFRCPCSRDRIPESTFEPTEYIGIAGLGPDAAALPMDDPRAGFFGDERMLSAAQILDHKCTLLAVLETSKAHGAWTAPGPSTVRGLDPNAPPYLGINGQFGGNHPGIANALFADASVRAIRQTIDPSVLESIATIQGSKGVGPAGDW